jgi:NADPH:quinone reductase-like Zn-dependent oxidoreductase
VNAFIIDRYGSSTRLRAGVMPDPVMQKDDVLVQIHAAARTAARSALRVEDIEQDFARDGAEG